MKLSQAFIQQIIESVRLSRKYRHMTLPDDLLIDILVNESPKYSDQKALVVAFRKKLHEVVAPYLEDINYQEETQLMEAAFQTKSVEQIEEYFRSILSKHASTKERLPYLNEIYLMIFSITGDPHIIIDLACAMHPFGIPWMGLGKDIAYYAYDVHQPRLDLINRFFSLYQMQPLAIQQDILVSPPKLHANVTFLFKEAHRIQKRKPGSNLELWQALDTDWLVVSLPTQDLKGHHDLSARYHQLVVENNPGCYELVHEASIGHEIFYFLKHV